MKSEASNEPIDPEDDVVVGLKGELGVRYGLELSIIGPNATKYTFTSVEMDVLDVAIAELSGIDGNSKQLLCLLNMLKKERDFKLLTEYIFPMKKLLSCAAIYNDLGFLPSIGEKTVSPDEALGEIPGVKVTITDDLEVEYSNTTGWAPMSERVSEFTPLILTYDEWDQVLLRNSKSRIKKMFDQAYGASNPNFLEVLKTGFSLGPIFDTNEIDLSILDKTIGIPSLPERIKSQLLEKLSNDYVSKKLPRFRKADIVTNPFNVDGKLCEK